MRVVKYWTRLLLLCHPQCPPLRPSWTIRGVESFLNKFSCPPPPSNSIGDYDRYIKGFLLAMTYRNSKHVFSDFWKRNSTQRSPTPEKKSYRKVGVLTCRKKPLHTEKNKRKSRLIKSCCWNKKATLVCGSVVDFAFIRCFSPACMIMKERFQNGGFESALKVVLNSTLCLSQHLICF